MENAETDQVPDEVQEDQSSGEQSTEDNEEEISAERAYQLAKGLQKGYTQSMQELAEIRNNLETVMDKVNSKDEFDELGEDDVLTKSQFLKLLDDREKAQERIKTEESQKWQKIVDSQVANLRIRGVISSDKDENELLDFATKHKITDLSQAAEVWKELKEVRTAKEKLRTKVRGEEGSRVGTSEKATVGKDGASFSQVHNKDWDEL